MRYLTDDDQIFNDIEDAKEHEYTRKLVMEEEANIEAFLKDTAPNDEGDRARTRRRNLIQAWVGWNAKREAGDRVVRAIA